jgi:tryptophan-rich sensory protein
MMMGVAAGLVWDRIEVEKRSRKSVVFFAIQLALMLCGRICSSITNPMLATRNNCIVVDDFETYIQFAKNYKIAGYLFIPYLAGFCCGVEWKYLVVE